MPEEESIAKTAIKEYRTYMLRFFSVGLLTVILLAAPSLIVTKIAVPTLLLVVWPPAAVILTSLFAWRVLVSGVRFTCPTCSQRSVKVDLANLKRLRAFRFLCPVCGFTYGCR